MTISVFSILTILQPCTDRELYDRWQIQYPAVVQTRAIFGARWIKPGMKEGDVNRILGKPEFTWEWTYSGAIGNETLYSYVLRYAHYPSWGMSVTFSKGKVKEFETYSSAYVLYRGLTYVILPQASNRPEPHKRR